MQIAEIYHEFILQTCCHPTENSETKFTETERKCQQLVLDQYFELMHPDQHKDVVNRTLESTPILLKTFLSSANRDTV